MARKKRSTKTKRTKKKKETPIQKKAFEYYRAMGPDRSIKKVAEKFGYSVKTVYDWSSRYRWRERIQQHELRETERLRGFVKKFSREAEEYLIEKNTNLLKLIDLSVQRYFHEVEADPDRVIPLETTADLRTIIELTRLLLGEPTEIRREESYVADRTRELLERLKRTQENAEG